MLEQVERQERAKGSMVVGLTRSTLSMGKPGTRQERRGGKGKGSADERQF